MNHKINRIWGTICLLNWVAVFLVCLVVSLPARESILSLDEITLENLEHNDSESEKEAEDKSKEIDSDDYLIESITTQFGFYSSFHTTHWKFRNFQDDFQTIFDPPPEQ
jgi:hypothetical protein